MTCSGDFTPPASRSEITNGGESPLIHPGNDPRPPERCVGYGIQYSDACLTVTCGTCRAGVGQACTRRGGGSHQPRQDKAQRAYRGKALRLFEKLEGAALRRNPDGPLWSFQSLPHHCGTRGAHVLTDCTSALAFRSWLVANHAGAETAVGDLARDAQADRDFPAVRVPDELVAHLCAKGASADAVNAARAAWADYSATGSAA